MLTKKAIQKFHIRCRPSFKEAKEIREKIAMTGT
jgi:hypothetical protein